MKKLFLIASALLIFAQAANAQESFKHLSLGLDVATTGIGLQVAVPVVTDHLVLTAGYNYANFSTKQKNNVLEMTDVSSTINQYVNKANTYLGQIPGETRRLDQVPNSANTNWDAKLKMGTFKAILEYYPTKKSSFHINAGIYVGGNNIINANASMPEYWNTYNKDVTVAKNVAADHPEYSSVIGQIPELKATINNRTFEIKDGTLNLGLNEAKVRPYLGFGFGRSFPKSHFGFQFDCGAMYTGKLKIVSTNEVGGTSSIIINDEDIKKVINTIEKICIYPQMSFRLIYKIF